ncbi:hypothetical protein ABZX92_22965 [Lentzea sp. NPDC006480]|uniref:hypothetical protein n=1 Tax=Lentzea sp. NPDC006480 TaxID=3157176 RepID=UPI0033B43CD9
MRGTFAHVLNTDAGQLPLLYASARLPRRIDKGHPGLTIALRKLVEASCTHTRLTE